MLCLGLKIFRDSFNSFIIPAGFTGFTVPHFVEMEFNFMLPAIYPHTKKDSVTPPRNSWSVVLSLCQLDAVFHYWQCAWMRCVNCGGWHYCVSSSRAGVALSSTVARQKLGGLCRLCISQNVSEAALMGLFGFSHPSASQMISAGFGYAMWN